MSHARSSLKIAITAGKVVLALGIVGYLVAKIQRDAGFSRLLHEPKEWGYLAAALAMVFAAFTLSFVRWYVLVQGLGMRFSLRDALRLGSMGFTLNQVMPGSVGGDLFKAAFLAHEQPGRRTEAVASVFIDRFIGLVAMFVVASVGLLFANQSLGRSPWLSSLEVTIWSVAIGGVVGILLVTSHLFSGLKTQQLASRVPAIGHILSRLVAGLNRFSSRRRYLAAAFAMAITTHCLLVSTFWCISRGLPIVGPTFQQNTTIVPLALVAGALPLTPGGLGITETALAKLYGAIQLNEADGALVALTYRAVTYVVAIVGACYYLSAKRRFEHIMEEAEELAEEIE